METKKLTVEDFLKEAEPSLARLKSTLGGKNLIVSDVIDAEGNQYVNLVQEGGGVLGVALLGYTYVLEQMGIRFMKMAGTSAGAINTMMLTCLGARNEAKSVKALQILSEKNLFDFVDGSSYIRGLIKRLITSTSYIKRLLWIAGITSVIFLASFLFLVYELGTRQFGLVFYITFAIMALSGGLITTAILWLLAKRREFFKAEFGLNPGNTFMQWVQEILHSCGIKNLEDLRKHVEAVPQGKFSIRPERSNVSLDDLNNPKLEDFLVLVTSDITNQMKVEFPRHWPLYWKNMKDVDPSCFVRASMAVPVFFKPLIVDNIDQFAVAPHWEKILGFDNKDLIPVQSRFVDGGMISNFPINVFYNPGVEEPRLPTFGILLEDEDAVPPRTDYTSFLSYVGAMFNTVRYNYDKEFLIKNADWNRTVGRIDVRGVNWLNFNLTNEDKLKLFRKGAEAAAAFLLGEPTGVPTALSQAPKFKIVAPAAPPAGTVADRSAADPDLESFQQEEPVGFDWRGYKAKRKKMHETLNNL